jgi:hypothetical protein
MINNVSPHINRHFSPLSMAIFYTLFIFSIINLHIDGDKMLILSIIIIIVFSKGLNIVAFYVVLNLLV